MPKYDKEIKITDIDEIEKLREFFNTEENKIEKKYFASLAEERSRTIKVLLRKKIKSSVDKVRDVIFNNVAKDLHANLNFLDLEEGSFYRTSGKSGKVIIKIDMLNDEEISLLWFNNNQKFIKSIRIIGNDKSASVRFFVFVKGMERVELFFEKRIAKVYQEREKIAFKISIMKAKMILFEYSDEKKKAINNKIARMLNYSKKLF